MPDERVVLLTPEQAAEALGIGRWKLYDLLRQGRLRSLRIGSCRRISTDALREFIAEGERQEPRPRRSEFGRDPPLRRGQLMRQRKLWVDGHLAAGGHAAVIFIADDVRCANLASHFSL